jgi:hypothetical protein
MSDTPIGNSDGFFSGYDFGLLNQGNLFNDFEFALSQFGGNSVNQNLSKNDNTFIFNLPDTSIPDIKTDIKFDLSVIDRQYSFNGGIGNVFENIGAGNSITGGNNIGLSNPFDLLTAAPISNVKSAQPIFDTTAIGLFGTGLSTDEKILPSSLDENAANRVSTGNSDTSLWSLFSVDGAGTQTGVPGAMPELQFFDASGAGISNTFLLAAENGAGGVNQGNIDLVKKTAIAARDKVCVLYADTYPAAFKATLSQTAPCAKIFLINNQEEANASGKTADIRDVNAYVLRENPQGIYLNVPRIAKNIENLGEDSAVSTIAHEMVHLLTMPLSNRMDGDIKIKNGTVTGSETFPGAGAALSQSFTIPENGANTRIVDISIVKMINEGMADTLSIPVTGIESHNDAYQSYRDLNKELIGIVGMDTYKRAALENDPVAYKTLIDGALQLKSKYDGISAAKELEETRIFKNETAVEYNQCQADFAKIQKLDSKSMETLSNCYQTEIKLNSVVDSNFPAEKSNYNFSFSNAVKQELLKTMKPENMEIVDQKQLEAAIAQVWSRQGLKK